ncbi:phage tail tape measure protein [Pasteurella multocida]|uniref:Phage tail tape measure protein n=1 Tax=Pasteurella multocida TaxID=747 RepID=A0AAW8VB40_PASMD|nr:phage tail tape measure protein [Pasteurella multocida]MDH7436472.1 phage tail tape measure protein [Pasteurella multocida]MDT3453469.1 phage tail tape measure protein [Pasteurella multocida]MDY0516137.1 phage tail tape measure protein [Pasteurella multocida]MDY0639711.1 phage tail tape measure protein [Pasteurella multocida]MDY0673833.1 phage tail tape measure protein [Pasteurella multocida]
MSNNLELKVTLSALDKATAPFKSIIATNKKLAQSIANAKKNLKALENQKKVIENFKALKKSVAVNNAELAKAQNEAQKLSAKFAQLATPTAKMRKEMQQAQARVKALKNEKTNLQRKVNETKGALDKYGISTKNLGNANAMLNEKIKSANRALTEQNRQLKLNSETQARLNKARSSYDKTLSMRDKMAGGSMKAGLASGAIIGAEVAMLKPALSFEAEFSRVIALTRLDKNKNAEQINALREQAKQLGATTSFTSTDVAAGQGYLAMAGFNDNQILKSMPSILNMTKAADMEMGRVSDISSDILSGFKKSADDMTNVSDVLTLTFTTSNTNLELLGDSMKYVGPIATKTGQEFETMAAMVGLLGNVGIKGSQAGTSLRSMLNRLAGPPKSAAKALKKLNVQAKDAKGNLRPVTDILADIAAKSKKYGNADQMSFFKDIFGEEAATAAAELITQSGEDGIRKYAEMLKNASGTSAKVAETMADNLQGDLKNLESAREALGISVFDQNNTLLRGFTASLTEMLRGMNEWIKANPELAKTIFKLITFTALFLGGLSTLGLILVTIIGPLAATKLAFTVLGIKGFGAIGLLTKGLGLLKMAIMANPLGLFITAVIAGALLIYKYWDQVRAFFGGFWQGLKNGMAPVLEKFKPLGDMFGVVVGWIEKAVKWFTDLLSPVQSAREDLDKAASAGYKFGEWLAKGIDLVTKPLQWVIDSIKWVIDNVDKINPFSDESLKNMPKVENISSNAPYQQRAGQITSVINTASYNGMLKQSKATGGYTGSGAKYDPAGIVHRGEFVFNKSATSRLGTGFLSTLHSAKSARAGMLAVGLSAGIANAQPLKVDNRAPLSARSATVASAPMTVNITINAGASQNADDIARAVQRELARIENQRQARNRSRLADRD